MGTITGLTAEAMQAIVDSQIVGAAIVADHLILTRQDGSTLDAGEIGFATDISLHNADTSDVHGIADTTKLVRASGSGAETGLRVVRGKVRGSDGARLWGTGFTSSRASTGNYIINYDTDFSGDAVLVASFGGGFGVPYIDFSSSNHSQTVVLCRNDSDTANVDRDFFFIAFGPA